MKGLKQKSGTNKTMQINRTFALVCFGALSFGAIVFAQSFTNKPFFEAASIKVVANENFPADLGCEIFVGPKGSPYFRAEGKQSQVKAVTLESTGAGPAVSLVRIEGKTNSYALYVFTEDTEGKIVGLFDLNMDGVWDVKRTPTQKQKDFIFFDNQWVAVARIDGLLSAKPVAEGPAGHYEFRGGMWKHKSINF
jgi:hypothetical protein